METQPECCTPPLCRPAAPFSTEPYTLERSFAARFKPPASLYFLKKTGCGLSRRGWQLFPSGGHAALPCSKAAFYPVFEDVFSAVDRDEADFGVIPVENSSAGSVSDVYDLLLRYRFSIVAPLIFYPAFPVRFGKTLL